jgi:2-C-methyl-D-erythritol 4-phosphate cytidylyltransferase
MGTIRISQETLQKRLRELQEDRVMIYLFKQLQDLNSLSVSTIVVSVSENGTTFTAKEQDHIIETRKLLMEQIEGHKKAYYSDLLEQIPNF